MMRRASSHATTISTARTTMDRNGLRQVGPSPAASAAVRATGGSRSWLSEYRASGPTTYGSDVAQPRVQGVRVGHLLLGDPVVERFDRERPAAAGDEGAGLDRVVPVGAQRDVLVRPARSPGTRSRPPARRSRARRRAPVRAAAASASSSARSGKR